IGMMGTIQAVHVTEGKRAMTWQNDGTATVGMTRRRGFARLVVGAAGASALWMAACGTAAQNTPAPAATVGPTTLDAFISTQSGPEPARMAALDALKQKYPQITLQTTLVGGSADAEQKVPVAAAANTMPD